MSVLLTPEETHEIAERINRGNCHWDTFRNKQDKAVAKAQAQRIAEWGEDICREHQTHIDPQLVKRLDCPKCWQAFKEEVGV